MKPNPLLTLSFGTAIALSPLATEAFLAAPAVPVANAKNSGTMNAKPVLAPVMVPLKAEKDWKTQLQGDQRIAHVLNRMAFGARPSEIEAVKKIGLAQWIDSQLNPKSIDDTKVEARIARLPLLNADPDLLRLAYEGDNGMLRKLLDGKAQEVTNKKLQKKAGDRTVGDQANGAAPAAAPMAVGDRAAANPMLEARINARQQQLMDEYKASGLERGASLQALGELSSAKLARAIDSNRQLQEVLADFWSNHFNVDVRKGPVRAMKIVDDREVIRPHLFGSFRELLGASAKSPAMLWYLDNYRSTAEMTVPRQNGKKRGGLNENYARELMELHTLGVDGGYTQKDVTEVARCFTGWGIGNGANRPMNGANRPMIDRMVNRRNRLNGRANGQNANAQPAKSHLLTFRFNQTAHDRGAKQVLGRTIAAGDQSDGETVLDLLASNPSTAKFIAHKLCIRFIADDPPASAVDKVAAAFTASNGDLKTVYRALFTSPEFNSVGAYRAKIKSPFEFAVSAVRALDGHFSLADPANPRQRLWLVALGTVSAGQNNRAERLPRRPIGSEIANMGQPMWACQPPTGWSEKSQIWVSSSALVARLNFALSLTSGRIGDVELESDILRATPIDQLSRDLLSGDMDASTRAVVASEEKSSPGDGAKTRALILGSPEFQRR